MTRKQLEHILRKVLSLPTAPFAEQHVLDHIRSFVAARPSLRLREDRAGNLLVHYQHGKKKPPRPVCLTAHLDHPGFVAERMTSKMTLRGIWRGGVMCEYFPSARVRFFDGDGWVKGKVRSIKTVRAGARTVVKTALIDVAGPVPPGCPGMWDFPDPAIRNGRIYTRAADDLAGVGAMLACAHALDATEANGEVYLLFTRAEEVGFVGAMAACKLKTIPKRCVVVAIETSSELKHARMGDGPILRVGDKGSTFTSAATAFAGAVASDLAATKKRFAHQRRLMDGGTCESTAYCALGYDATGICLALGNYHNMNKRTGKLGPEYIDLDDFASLVDWFIALATTKRRYTGRDTDLNKRLDGIQREHNALLYSTA